MIRQIYIEDDIYIYALTGRLGNLTYWESEKKLDLYVGDLVTIVKVGESE